MDGTERAVTTIRANCPNCGDVQLTSGDLTVRVCADTERGSYSFHCPECARAVAKDASQRIVDLLVSSGVRMQVWRLPAEVHEDRLALEVAGEDVLAPPDAGVLPDSHRGESYPAGGGAGEIGNPR